MGCDVRARLPSGIIFSYTAQVWPPPEGIGPAPMGSGSIATSWAALMPHQSLLYACRVHACANLPQLMPNRSRIVPRAQLLHPRAARSLPPLFLTHFEP